MNFAISFMDILAACLFFAAAVVTIFISHLRGRSTRLWSLVSVAFVIFAIERSLNALEWSTPGDFAWVDTFQGYLSTLACLVLLATVLDFWRLLRRAGEARPG